MGKTTDNLKNRYMKKNKIYISVAILISSVFFACNQAQNYGSIIESPLAVVVKFESAQSIRDYETAKTLFNLESVYGKIAKESNMSAEIFWKQLVEFNYSIGNSSPKFSTCFPFQNYTIKEKVGNKTSVVQFINKDKNAPIKEIKYTLSQTNQSNWIISTIDYIKL
jgi:hypothetical protein